MNIPVNLVTWLPCWRIIPSRFPPIELFERAVDPADLEAIYELESLTNDHLREEAGELQLVPSPDRIAGRGTSYIMAAFTHLNPAGSRFSVAPMGSSTPRIPSMQLLLKHIITASSSCGQRLSPLWNLICGYYWPICTSNCMISAVGNRNCLISMLLTTIALRKPWGNGCERKAPGVLPMTVCVIPVGSTPPCSGLQP